MQTTGIICEYNPMHSGHAHQLRVARDVGADCIVLVMSGSFTERGEFAVLDKYARAEMALRAGADLVLELPYPFSAGSAEYFATAGVGILSRLSVDTLCFGSETGDGAFLERAAETALSDSFRAAFSEAGKSGVGSAAAYFNLLSAHMGVSDFGSNDVLGVEYLKALRTLRSSVKPLVIRREGSAYHAADVTKGMHPSATAIRNALFSADSAECADAYECFSGLSAEVTASFRRAVVRGAAPVRPENASAAILGFYRMHTPEDLCGIAEMHGGLAERICRAAREATDLSTFYTLAATKKYTDSRVRRAILYGMTGVTEEDLKAAPAYVNLLGASDVGRTFLSEYRRKKDADLPVITRPAAILDSEANATFRRQAELQLRAEALYTLAFPMPQAAGRFLKERAVLV